MQKAAFIAALKRRFQPRTLAIGRLNGADNDSVFEEIFRQALRIVNVEAPETRISMVAYTCGATYVLPENPEHIVDIWQVWPNALGVVAYTPEKFMFGKTELTRDMTDYLLRRDQLKTEARLLGKEMYWQWIPPQLLVDDVPEAVTGLTYKYGYRYEEDDDITDDARQKWILDYMEAGARFREGTFMRESQLIGASTAGADMAREGEASMATLVEALRARHFVPLSINVR